MPGSTEQAKASPESARNSPIAAGRLGPLGKQRRVVLERFKKSLGARSLPFVQFAAL
jgi:hypothetical protein